VTDHDGRTTAASAGPDLQSAELAGRPGDQPVDPDVLPADREALERQLAAAPAPAGSLPPARMRGRARTRYLRRRMSRVLADRWDILVMIAAGGALGSLARWQLSQLVPHRAGTFPWATFETNVSGCVVLGVLMVFVVEVWPPSRYVRPFLGVGVLGGFTTFSTYMLDVRGLLVAGDTTTAGSYLFGSLAAGLAGVWAGVTLARLAVRTAERRRLRQHAPDRLHSRPGSSISTSTTRSPR